METRPHHIPTLFDKEYFNNDSSTSSSPHLKSPATGVRLIGGLQFEVFVLNTKRFFVPYHCFSCTRIKDSLLEVSDEFDDDTDSLGSGSKDTSEFDEDISEWAVNNETLERFWFGSTKKGLLTESKAKPYDSKVEITRLSQGYFKGPKSLKNSKKGNLTGGSSDRQKYALKYTHRDEVDLHESKTKYMKADDPDVEECDSYQTCGKEDGSMSSYTVTDELKPWPSFTYVDTRLEYYSPRNSTIQIQNHEDLKQFCQESISYTSGQKEDKERFYEVFSSDSLVQSENNVDLDASDFIHYVDHKFHLEHYKLQKHMTRQKEARALSAKQKEPEQRLSLPRILRELPEALRADLEFWSTYDSARKKQNGKSSEDPRSFLPQIDVTKESLVNLALLDQQKNKTKWKVKENGLGLDKKTNQKKKPKSTKNTSKTKSNSTSSRHLALKGGTAPKHFVDHFNALRVKSSGNVPDIDKELKHELALLRKGDVNYS